MSRSGTDQKKRRMVVGVLALLVLVATINVRTFLTDDNQPTVRSEVESAELPLPYDLEEAALKATVHLAAMRAGEGTDLEGQSGVAGGGGRGEAMASNAFARRFTDLRDPFRRGDATSFKHTGIEQDGTTTGQAEIGDAASNVTATGITKSPRPMTGGLVCTAVMLGVGAPRARIDGRYVGVGDEVDGYRVIHIDRKGALLKKKDKELFLSVEAESTERTYHRPVTEAQSGEEAGDVKQRVENE